MTDFTNDENRREFAYTVAAVAENLGDTYPMLIGGERVAGIETFASLNPSRPSETLARFPVAGEADVARAMVAAETALESWRQVPASERAAMLSRAAETLRRRRLELAAWCCFEAGLTWAEADAEAAAAIGCVEELGDEAATGVRMFPSTFSSPLAMTAAAMTAPLRAGDTVVVRPDPRVSTIAWKLVEVFLDAGLPAGAVNFVTSIEAWDESAAPPEPFTIASEADLDAVLTAAFAHAGQRHPYVVHAVVHPDVFDDVARAARDAAAGLTVGPAIDFQTDVGPVIDEVSAYRACGFLGVALDGWFVPPTVLVDQPRVDEPVPGPILTLERGDVS